MPSGARKHEDRRNRWGNRGASLRKGLQRSGRAGAADGVARYSGALRSDAGRALSAQCEEDFFCREGIGEILTDIWCHVPKNVWATADATFRSVRLFFKSMRADIGRRHTSLRIDINSWETGA